MKKIVSTVLFLSMLIGVLSAFPSMAFAKGADGAVKPLEELFTVTFMDEYGEIIDVQTVPYGGAATYPTPPIKENNHFLGWDVDCSYVTSDLVVTAYYSGVSYDEYTVKFVAEAGGYLNGGAEFVMQQGSAFSQITVPTPIAVENYVFVGWDKAFAETVESDLVYTAKFEYVGTLPVQLGITGATYANGYITVNGTWAYMQPQWDVAIWVTNGNSNVCFKNVKFSDLTVDGNSYSYKFMFNPNDVKEGLTVNVKPVTLSIVADSAPLQFDAAAVTYTVSFVDYDGAELSTETVSYGSAATAPADPVREGYTFTGWDKTFDCITADTVITANYEINKYTVSFVVYGGNVLATYTVEHGSAATAPNVSGIEGYTFTGWDKAFDCITADTVITANYEINKYTVSFVDYDGKVLSTQTVEYGKGATAPADPVREGYTFDCWSMVFDRITVDVVITAIYKINSYTVSFVDCDGKVLSTQTVEYGKGATAPADPARVGYDFTGWDKAFASIIADTTVTATYKPAIKLGDVNGDGKVNSLDAAMVLRADAGLLTLNDNQKLAADVNRDGKVNSLDAAKILRYDAGIIKEL